MKRGISRGHASARLLCLTGAIALLLTAGCRRPKAERLDDLKLEPLTGQSQAIAPDDLKGQVVVLNFWGTWCPPCRQEFPHILEMWRHYRQEKDCQILAVSCGSGAEDAGQLKSETTAFLAERDAGDFPCYSDLERRTRMAVQRAVGFEGYPTTLIIDRQGKIRGTWFDYRNGTELEMVSLLEQCLKEEKRG
ncbi:MAG: TlpA family protein disulfide reductase [Planctomycetes bacterium]|nr:TlpA family protein disulfide reductase [Planctomycetota bacterium]